LNLSYVIYGNINGGHRNNLLLKDNGGAENIYGCKKNTNGLITLLKGIMLVLR